MADGRQFNGGAREGAGRPPKVVEDAARSVLLELFNDKEERLIVANMIANAKRKGITAAPSATSAATWLWDRKYGKVKDRTELSGPDGAAIPLEIQRIDYRDGFADVEDGSVSDPDAPG